MRCSPRNTLSPKIPAARPRVSLCRYPIAPHIGWTEGMHAADPRRPAAATCAWIFSAASRCGGSTPITSRATCWATTACTISRCATRPRCSCCSPALARASPMARCMNRQGYLYAAADTLRRAWTLYIAHIFLFVVYTAQVAYSAAALDRVVLPGGDAARRAGRRAVSRPAGGAAAALSAQPAEHPAALRGPAADLRARAAAVAQAGAAVRRYRWPALRGGAYHRDQPAVPGPARAGSSIRSPGSSCS